MTVRKLWNDPVLSKVIALGIFALLGWFLNAKGILSGLWTFLMSKSEIPNWMLSLLIVASLFSLVIFIMVMWDYLSNPKSEWHSYTKDIFYNLNWTWNYESDNQIYGLVCLCPKCNFQIDVHNSTYYNENWFDCENCQFSSYIDLPQFNLRHLVVKQIHRKIRTNEWKNEIKK